MENSKNDQIDYILKDLYTDEANAQYHSKCQNYMAKKAQKKNLILGTSVTILSAIVGNAVFASLRKDSNEYIKIIAGVLSIITTVLSTLQSFFGFSKEVENRRKAAHSYELVLQTIKDLFLDHKLHLGKITTEITQQELALKARGISKEVANLNQNEPIISDKADNKFKYIIEYHEARLIKHAENAK